jgi:hypothetical protein
MRGMLACSIHHITPHYQVNRGALSGTLAAFQTNGNHA